MFHDDEQEKLRIDTSYGLHSFIQGPLDGFVRANAEFVAGVQRRTPEKIATLDMDATLAETHKREVAMAESISGLNSAMNFHIESRWTIYTYHDKIRPWILVAPHMVATCLQVP